MLSQLFKIDVEMQGFCQTYAAEFNKRNPPKPVVFLDAFLIVCINRPKQPIFACEPMVRAECVRVSCQVSYGVLLTCHWRISPTGAPFWGFITVRPASNEGDSLHPILPSFGAQLICE